MSDPKTEEGCISCRFWDDHRSQHSVGDCRKEPPTLAVTIHPTGGVWPTTDAGAWCGGWESEKPAVEPYGPRHEAALFIGEAYDEWNEGRSDDAIKLIITALKVLTSERAR